MAMTEPYHHRSTTKTVNKPFKTRHATKSSLKNRAKGKVEALEKGSRKTPHQQVMSKLDRRNQAKQRRLNHHAEREHKSSVFTGRDGAPRIVAVIPLCNDIKPDLILRSLNTSVDVDDAPGPLGGSRTVQIPRFKQQVQYLCPPRELLQCLDICRVADFVLFVLSAQEEVDARGEQILRCIESQGVSTVLTGIYGLDQVEPAKKRPDVVKSLKSFISHFFPTQEKLHDLGNRQDCSNVMRSLCTTLPKGIRWRETRSWAVIDQCEIKGTTAVVTGFVRGRGLKADRLVQLGDWGDLQIEKITAAPPDTKMKRGRSAELADDHMTEEGKLLDSPTEGQDDLMELAPEEVTMEDITTASVAPSERKAVLLDDHHYFEEESDQEQEQPRRLPRGTSKYQAAWYLGDFSDSGSDLEDVDYTELNGDHDIDLPAELDPEEGGFDEVMREPTEAGPESEYPQSEAFLDPAPEDELDEIETYRRQRRTEAEGDLEFPDEIELHPHVLARERLARYRGLKSVRTSPWETTEDKPYEPYEWRRLLEIAEYKSAYNRVIKESVMGGVPPGTRVNVYLRIPEDRQSEIRSLPAPTSLFTLLKHEHKCTAVNVSMTLSSDHPVPIKSKEPVIVQYGCRRMLIHPLFSQAGNTPNNVHKFERYLHPGRTAVASFTGPITWGSVPCLFFQPPVSPPAPSDAVEALAQSLDQRGGLSAAPLELIGTGTTLAPSTSRVVAKRVVLTGHPYKIHKRVVTVRYMFFNAEDVAYFKALQLWTRRGRSGFIREPLGTHGYFKAAFDAKISPLDAVAVSLYKRVWPRPALPWREAMDGVGQSDAGDARG